LEGLLTQLVVWLVLVLGIEQQAIAISTAALVSRVGRSAQRGSALHPSPTHPPALFCTKCLSFDYGSHQTSLLIWQAHPGKALQRLQTAVL
jgi:hypothetical protein